MQHQQRRDRDNSPSPWPVLKGQKQDDEPPGSHLDENSEIDPSAFYLEEALPFLYDVIEKFTKKQR